MTKLRRHFAFDLQCDGILIFGASIPDASLHLVAALLQQERHVFAGFERTTFHPGDLAIISPRPNLDFFPNGALSFLFFLLMTRVLDRVWGVAALVREGMVGSFSSSRRCSDTNPLSTRGSVAASGCALGRTPAAAIWL